MDPDKQRLIDVLENRAKEPKVAEVRRQYFDAMELPAEALVLDVGCGSGVVARSLASRSGFAGSIIAIDKDEALLEAARKFADEEGVADQIDFRTGDGHQLDFPDSSFDGVTAQTAISHMHGPKTVLVEIARVLKSGGTLAIFDGDYESRAFSCEDHELARTAEAAWRAMQGHSPRLARDMPRLLVETGFEIVEVIPHVEIHVGDGDTWPEAAERFAPRMVETGLITSEESERWLGALKEDAARGTVFTASNYYAFVGRRL